MMGRKPGPMHGGSEKTPEEIKEMELDYFGTPVEQLEAGELADKRREEMDESGPISTDEARKPR